MELALIIFLFLFLLHQRSELSRLQKTFTDLQKTLSQLIANQSENTKDNNVSAPNEKLSSLSLRSSPSISMTKTTSIQPQPENIVPVYQPIPGSNYAEDFMDKYASQLAWIKENWTGLIGVSILVIGIAFIQVYLSVNLGPLVRFSSLFSVALFLLGVSFYIRRRFKLWEDLSSWLQAASGAGLPAGRAPLRL